MKIVHVIPHLCNEASGPTYVVNRLSQIQAQFKHDVQVVCLAYVNNLPGVTYNICAQWPILSKFAVSTKCIKVVREKSKQSDIIHDHGLWSMINVVTGCVVSKNESKLIVSPHGALSVFAMNQRKYIKRILWPLQRKLLENADMIHATCEEEYNDVRRMGITVPVAIIPNGIDVNDDVIEENYSSSNVLLYLGRLHPIKCIDRLLLAWQKIYKDYSDWQLHIVGIGEEKYEKELKRMVLDLGMSRVSFIGPLYGVDKFNAYKKADIYVLPSHSENFGVTVAEALANGCPSIVSKGAPWSGLIEKKCGWWIDNSIDIIAKTLEDAFKLGKIQLRIMGENGKQWMKNDYSWYEISGDMQKVYNWMLTGGEPPLCIKIE